MSTKIRNIFIGLAAVSLAALAFCSHKAGNVSLLLISPKTESASVSVDDAEDLNEKFLLTYSANQSSSVRVLNGNFSVTLKHTNYSYPFTLGYVMKSGGFFTSQHQEQKQKKAVLNEKAAFDLLGSVDIIGSELKLGREKYEIVGVIDDGDTQRNVFLPITLTAQAPAALVAALDSERGITPQYVTNELNQAGVSEAAFNFYNLEISAGRTSAKSIFAVGCAVFALAVWAIKFCIPWLSRCLADVKSSMTRHYIPQLVRKDFWNVARLLSTALLTAGLAALMIWLLTLAVEGFLTLQVFDSYLELYSIRDLNAVASLEFLREINMYSDFCLIVFLISTVGGLLASD